MVPEIMVYCKATIIRIGQYWHNIYKYKKGKQLRVWDITHT